MQVRVHRGCREIGGSCVEVAADGARLVLDVGRPLTARWDEQVPLPPVPGLGTGDPSLLGVLISHPHLDHYGLLDQVSPSIPVYAGEAAAAIVTAARFFSPAGPPLRPTGYLRDREPLRLGPFTVTPLLVDHSAYDAHALVIDAAGRRLVYSGDLRGHGRKARLFRTMVNDPPSGVDTLLMEGTHVPAEIEVDERPAVTESQVEHEMAATFRDTAGMPVVISSAQNIDRLVTVYRATRRAGRTLVLDLYGATVAAATGRPTIPQAGFPALGVFVAKRQQQLLDATGETHRLDPIAGCRTTGADLTADPGGYVVLSQAATVPELFALGTLERGVVIWSLWEGYLEGAAGSRLTRRLRDEGVPLVAHHTSGHACLSDLAALATAIAPNRLVPIHTAGADRFGAYFGKVAQQEDGVWWAARATPPPIGPRRSRDR